MNIVYIALPVMAVLTSALSGMIGMGGGMMLLATMFCFLTHAEAIPAHAAVQLISNSTRTFAFLGHVHWPTVGRFFAGVVPGSLLGVSALLLTDRPETTEPYLKSLVGAYILAAALIPIRPAARKITRWWEFPALGVAAGAAAFTLGAVGPLIAPLFARRDFAKEKLIATKAVCQSLLHLATIPVFLTLRSSLLEQIGQLGALTLLMGLLVIPGTLLGKRCLRWVSENRFRTLYRAALLAAGAKVLIWDGLRPLVAGT